MTPRWHTFLFLSLIILLVSYRVLTTQGRPWCHYGARYDRCASP